MSEMTNVRIEVRDHIGILTIDRPDALNALNIATLLEMEAALSKLEADSDVRVIVVTGAGERAFVAGGDINDLNSRQGLAHYQEFAEIIHRCFRRFEECDKPTIAAINGWALGGGTELLLSLDIRIASHNAKFGLPEIGLGLFPGAGGSQRMLRQIPLCRTRELIFTGQRFSAEEAVAWGLINRSVAQESLMTDVLETAKLIAAKSPLTLKLTKRTLRYGADMSHSAALAFEQAMIGLVLDSEDAHEGCSAFLEKRTPVFRGQ